MAPLELAGRKPLALFGRAKGQRRRRRVRPRFNASTLQRFDASTHRAQLADPGFDLSVLAQMVSTLDQFTDVEILADPDVVPALRDFFAHRAAELVVRDS